MNTIDITPLMTEVFKMQASINTLTSVLLSENQKQEFSAAYSSHLKDVISSFAKDHSHLIEDVDELLNKLS